MDLPGSLFYYYEAAREPFLSMSELADEAFTALMDELADSGVPDNRFDEDWKRDFYRFFRPYTERKIRARFVEKGGKPVLHHPRYLTLGPTRWFYDWYRETKTIEVPLAEVPSESVSFTYPDSMMSMLIAEDRYEPFAQFKQPYHGEVYRLEELPELISAYGFPDEDDPKNLEYGNRIIEAQIWDFALLEPYI